MNRASKANTFKARFNPCPVAWQVSIFKNAEVYDDLAR